MEDWKYFWHVSAIFCAMWVRYVQRKPLVIFYEKFVFLLRKISKKVYNFQPATVVAALIQTVKNFSQNTEWLIGPTFSVNSSRLSKDIFSVCHWLMTSLNITLSSIDKILIGLTILFYDTLFDWSNQICQPLKHISIFNVKKYSINWTQRALSSLKLMSNAYDVSNNQLSLEAIK